MNNYNSFILALHTLLLFCTDYFSDVIFDESEKVVHELISSCEYLDNFESISSYDKPAILASYHNLGEVFPNSPKECVEMVGSSDQNIVDTSKVICEYFFLQFPFPFIQFLVGIFILVVPATGNMVVISSQRQRKRKTPKVPIKQSNNTLGITVVSSRVTPRSLSQVDALTPIVVWSAIVLM